MGRLVLFSMGAGADVWSAAYDRMVKAMLSEAELHQHNAAHSLVWLTAMTPLLQVCLPPFPPPLFPPISPVWAPT